jgi:hypothetical protein
VRDAVVCSADTINTVYTLSKIYKPLISRNPMSAMQCNSEETMYHRIDRVWRRAEGKNFYYLRDLKKCGLNANPYLISFIGECLDEIHPGKGFDYSSIFLPGNRNILPDKTWTGPLREDGCLDLRRGTSLGMANEIQTLCQIIIFEYIKSKIDIPDVDMITYNDDLAASGPLDQLELYRSWDKDVHSSLEIPLKEESLGILKNAMIFLEEYYVRNKDSNGPIKKSIRTILSIVDKKFCSCITEAKFAIRSFFVNIIQDYDNTVKWLEELKSFWGFEFTIEELYLPAIFGGWGDIRYMGLNGALDLPIIETVHSDLLDRLFAAEKVPFPSKGLKRYKPKFKAVDLNLFEEKLFKVPQFDFISGNRETLLRRAHLQISSSRAPVALWRRFRCMRRKAFLNASGHINLDDLFTKVIRESPDTFAIPERLISEWSHGYTIFVSKGATIQNMYSITDKIRIQESYLDGTLSGRLDERSLISQLGHEINFSLSEYSDLVAMMDRNENLDDYYINPLKYLAYYHNYYGKVPVKTYLDETLPRRLSALEEEFPASAIKSDTEQLIDLICSYTEEHTIHGLYIFDLLSYDEPVRDIINSIRNIDVKGCTLSLKNKFQSFINDLEVTLELPSQDENSDENIEINIEELINHSIFNDLPFDRGPEEVEEINLPETEIPVWTDDESTVSGVSDTETSESDYYYESDDADYSYSSGETRV